MDTLNDKITLAEKFSRDPHTLPPADQSENTTACMEWAARQAQRPQAEEVKRMPSVFPMAN